MDPMGATGISNGYTVNGVNRVGFVLEMIECDKEEIPSSVHSFKIEEPRFVDDRLVISIIDGGDGDFVFAAYVESSLLDNEQDGVNLYVTSHLSDFPGGAIPENGILSIDIEKEMSFLPPAKIHIMTRGQSGEFQELSYYKHVRPWS
jgi:hypothetical protein